MSMNGRVAAATRNAKQLREKHAYSELESECAKAAGADYEQREAGDWTYSTPNADKPREAVGGTYGRRTHEEAMHENALYLKELAEGPDVLVPEGPDVTPAQYNEMSRLKLLQGVARASTWAGVPLVPAAAPPAPTE